MTRADDAVRLRHMQDAANKALAFAQGRMRADLDSDEMFALALVRLLEVIGEAAKGISAAFRDRHDIPEDATLLCVLPGSRKLEIKHLLDIFGETVELLAAELPRLQVVVPVVPTVSASVSRAAGRWPVPTRVVRGDADKFDAFAAADIALAASGTVSLELAMAGVPMVIAYRAAAITAAVVRRLVSEARPNAGMDSSDLDGTLLA